MKKSVKQSIANNISVGNEQMQIDGRAVTYDHVNENKFLLTRDDFANVDFPVTVAAYSEHDRKNKIGIATLNEDDTGITVTFKLNPEKQNAKDVWSDVKFGTTTAISIGFRAYWEYHENDKGEYYYTVKDPEFFEVSLVDDPADKTAKIEAIQSNQGGQEMPNSTKRTLKALTKQTFNTPDEIITAMNSIDAEIKVAEGTLKTLNFTRESEEERNKLNETQFAKLEDDVTATNKNIVELQADKEQLKNQLTQMQQSRRDAIKANKVDLKQSKGSKQSTEFTTKRIETKFASDLENFVTEAKAIAEAKRGRQNATQANNSNELVLAIPETIADSIIEEAKKDNKSMWPYFKKSNKKSGDTKRYLFSELTYNANSGRYQSNVQPSKSSMNVGSVTLALGTIATYMELSDMQIKSTTSETVKSFKKQVAEKMRLGLDAQAINNDGYDSEYEDYVGFNGVASSLSYEKGLAVKMEVGAIPNLNEFLKQATNLVGEFTHVWTKQEVFNEWQYEVDDLNRPLNTVVMSGGVPTIRGIKFIVNEAFEDFATSTEAKPAAIVLTPPHYEYTEPVSGALMTIIDRNDPNNWRQRQQAMFIDGSGTLTTKGKTAVVFKTATAGGVTPQVATVSELKQIANTLEIENADNMDRATLINEIAGVTGLSNIGTMTYAELLEAIE